MSRIEAFDRIGGASQINSLTKSSNPRSVPVNSRSLFMITHIRDPIHLSISSAKRIDHSRATFVFNEETCPVEGFEKTSAMLNQVAGVVVEDEIDWSQNTSISYSSIYLMPLHTIIASVMITFPCYTITHYSCGLPGVR